jgi:hypothetical protein
VILPYANGYGDWLKTDEATNFGLQAVVGLVAMYRYARCSRPVGMLAGISAAMTAACCANGCLNGAPSACDEACADILVPYFEVWRLPAITPQCRRATPCHGAPAAARLDCSLVHIVT